MSSGRTSLLLKLGTVGTAAGAFSGLFGVGGGTVIVPLLILWFAFGPRLATGTSLAAIAGIAVFATALHGLYGNVHWGTGLILAVPATAGIVLGAAAQQRIPQQAVSYVFAALLVASAIKLVVS